LARAVWTGTLTFGLVTIPVRLYPATEPKDVRFHLMDASGRRVRFRRFVEAEEPPVEWEAQEAGPQPDAEGPPEPRTTPSAEERPQPAEVAYEDLMRGYETEEGRVVLLSRAEA